MQPFVAGGKAWNAQETTRCTWLRNRAFCCIGEWHQKILKQAQHLEDPTESIIEVMHREPAHRNITWRSVQQHGIRLIDRRTDSRSSRAYKCVSCEVIGRSLVIPEIRH